MGHEHEQRTLLLYGTVGDGPRLLRISCAAVASASSLSKDRQRELTCFSYSFPSNMVCIWVMTKSVCGGLGPG